MSRNTQANPTQTPEQKRLYWLNLIVEKCNKNFPDFIKILDEIVQMANHGLDVDDRKKLRVMIANDIGRPLMKMEIPNDAPLPQPPQPPVQQDAAGKPPENTPPGATPAAPGNDPAASKENVAGNEEQLRSSVVPDAGSGGGPSEDHTSPEQPNK